MMAVSLAQKDIDDNTLIGIFGTPPPTTPSKVDLGDIVVKPTEPGTTFTDKNGQACKCVPYYLCNDKKVGVDINNTELTGWGQLDIRFGDDCQESVEICCTAPKTTTEVLKPKPDASKLKGCGYRNPNGVGVTITGGTGMESQFGEFPWVVALMDAINGSLVGVGVLIHPQVVVTGAHVASKYAPGNLIARAGEWDTQTVKEIYDFQDRNVREIYVHPEFNPKNLKNDIAVLHLDKAVQLAEHINMICLANQNENLDNSKNCFANGWGKDRFGVKGRYAVILKKVEVNMVEHSRCNMLLQRTRLGSRFILHNSFVCAGGEEGKDTCTGDGGAPLSCPIGDGRYKLAGLVSWGIGCGQKDVPAVYVSLPALRYWVDEIMNTLGYGTASYTV